MTAGNVKLDIAQASMLDVMDLEPRNQSLEANVSGLVISLRIYPVGHKRLVELTHATGNSRIISADCREPIERQVGHERRERLVLAGTRELDRPVTAEVEEHHRVAIAAIPGLDEPNPKAAGIEHFAFTFANIDDLFAQYEKMAAKGEKPYWTINHGFTLSAYYRDPDGNQVETQVDSMSMEEADEFMAGPLFAANPIGINVDFEELIARHRAGASFASITDYATAGK